MPSSSDRWPDISVSTGFFMIYIVALTTFSLNMTVPMYFPIHFLDFEPYGVMRILVRSNSRPNSSAVFLDIMDMSAPVSANAFTFCSFMISSTLYLELVLLIHAVRLPPTLLILGTLDLILLILRAFSLSESFSPSEKLLSSED